MLPAVGVALLVFAVACLFAAAGRQRFHDHIDALDATLQEPGPVQTARTDLPAEVAALAVRLGARADRLSPFVRLDQSGDMWRTPGGKPLPFKAQQTIRTCAPGFLWRARMGVIDVLDYLVSGTGGLEVRALGLYPVATSIGGATANKGELLRYLAELPWSPEAILFNRSLDWSVIDPKTIKVAAGDRADRGEVSFDLDDDGLIVRAGAAARGYLESDGRQTLRPWRGRFWDYHLVEGRLLPMQGEVA